MDKIKPIVYVPADISKDEIKELVGLGYLIVFELDECSDDLTLAVY